jgi:F-box and WD-40 domain protein 1/11
MLPDELAIYILLFVDLPEILACLRVSRHWRRIADDTLIWRNIYFRAGFGVDGHNVRQITRASQHEPSIHMPRTPSSPSSPPLSSRSKLAYYIPSYSSSLRASTSSFGTYNSLESNLQVVRHDPMVSSAPLSLDWKNMYKSRCDINIRLTGAEPAQTWLEEHTDAVYCVEYDGDKIVTGSRDRTIRVWTIKNGKPKVKMILTGHSASVLCLQFDHTGTMVSGSSDCSVIVWNLNAEPDKYVVDVLKAHNRGVLDIKMDAKWIVSWYVVSPLPVSSFQ